MAFASANVENQWIAYIGYVLAPAIVLTWIYLDRDNFLAFFKRKGFKYGASSGGVAIITVTSLVALAYVTQKETFNKRLDVTENKVSSLSQESLDLIEKFDASENRVSITGYFMNPEVQGPFARLIGLYQSFGAPIDTEFIEPAQNPEKVQAAELTSENTAIFNYGGRESRITTFTEEEVTNVLLNILKEGSKTVYFTKGHGEPSVTAADAEGFSIASDLLGKQKISVLDLSLMEEAKVPENADLIVIAGPQYDFKEAETQLLDKYLKGGGSVVVSVAPAVSLPMLKKWVLQYGLEISDDILLMDQRDPRVMFFGKGSVPVSDFDSVSGVTKKFSSEGSSRGGAEMILPLTRSVAMVNKDDKAESSENSGYEAQVIAKTPKYILKFGGVTSQESLSSLDPTAAQQGSYGVVGLSQLTAADDAGTDAAVPGKLLVAGSAHLLSNHGMKINKVNRDFMGSVVSYLTRDDNFVSIPIKEFAKGDIDLTSPASLLFYKLIVWIYPFLILGATLLYWLMRKRKTGSLAVTA